MLLSRYLNELGYPFIPPFLIKYLYCPSLRRLKNVGYFCGMDYASKDIYSFREYISRFDHSLTTSLMVYNLTHDNTQTIAALFHDVGTPCFSHVIDYMNKDYAKQESTEAYTARIIKNDIYLMAFLEKDNISLKDVINFKQFSVVDNERPKVCADRLDGLILTGIGWTRNISYDDIHNILHNTILYTNEDGEQEIGFRNELVAKKIVEVADTIDEYCHSKEDNYMMEYLACLTKSAIKKGIINYDDLYTLDEKQLFKILGNCNDSQIKSMLYSFQNMQKYETLDIYHPDIKKRVLKPMCNGKRM